MCQNLADKYPGFRSGKLFPVSEVIQLHPSPRPGEVLTSGDLIDVIGLLWAKDILHALLPQACISKALTLSNSRQAPFVLIFNFMLTQNAFRGQMLLCCIFYKKITGGVLSISDQILKWKCLLLRSGIFFLL